MPRATSSRTASISTARRRSDPRASPEPAVRARAALAVGRLQDSTTAPDLLPLLRDPDARVREEAVFALGQIGQRAAREPLEKLLPGADPALAALAIEALGKLGDR